MNQNIKQELNQKFQKHRIVFWFDPEKEMRADFEELSLNGVNKIELANNEFRVRFRLLQEEPDNKFLLYREGEQPGDLDNWLLDVQLANGEFRTDQTALWLAELELSPRFRDLVQSHSEFFRAESRRSKLKSLLCPDDEVNKIRLKMLAACIGHKDAKIHAILESLLQELANCKEDKFKIIRRSNLDRFFWEQLKDVYGYASESPNLEDFCIELFKSCYSEAVGDDANATLNQESHIFFKRWKDNRHHSANFEHFSKKSAEVLSVEPRIQNKDFRDLIDLDYFELIDYKIIFDLVKAIESQTETSADITNWIRIRQTTHWYGRLRHIYEAIDYSAKFINALNESSLEMESLSEGIKRYSRSWYRIDQLYRKYTYHLGRSNEVSSMKKLTQKIENLYVNNFLLTLGDRFQQVIDKSAGWDARSICRQNHFFTRFVNPFINKKKKIFVIISDALRYEIGDELLSLIRQEDRYAAELVPALSMLPSYTQLGMAALLPNRELSLACDNSATVMVNDQNSKGTANRDKILKKLVGDRAKAMKADDILAMGRDDCRLLIRDHDLIYVYHNRIDAVGDKRETEGQVFEAVQDTLEDLIKLIKKLVAANAYNLIITSDHGFLYQKAEIDQSDFAGESADGKEILYKSRRFVIGRGLKDTPSLRKFESKQIGLAGDMEVQIPKSVNRLRVKGSGSRFVHGGATLQEIVIPVITVNKTRQSDTSLVDVEILPGTSSSITSGQLTVTMYQVVPVTEKTKPRTLRAGIYSRSGDLISDSHDLVFDQPSDHSREREQHVQFMLTAEADKFNRQDVELRLEERHASTSHYKPYKSVRYAMNRSFMSDFDF